MARTANPTSMPPEDVDLPGLDTAKQAADAIAAHTQQVTRQLGYEGPYELTRIVGECRMLMASAAESMVELGERLLLIKEVEGHGNFLRICQDDLGIPPRPAQQLMKAALKFRGLSAANAKTFSHLGKSKLLELMIEDTEELEALAEGGTIAGLKLDDIERMSVRELREALRKEKAVAKQTREELEAQIGRKDDKINELDRKLNKKQAEPEDTLPEDRSGAALGALQNLTLALHARITTELLGKSTALLDAHVLYAERQHARTLIAGELAKLASAIRLIAADLEIVIPDAGQMVHDALEGDDRAVWDAVNAELQN